MSTNFYWKEIPVWFYDNAKDFFEVIKSSSYDRNTGIFDIKKETLSKEEYFQKVNEEELSDSIFKHIGKRSAAGLYCHRCGTTAHRYGTDQVHSEHNPDLSLIIHGEKEQFEKERNRYYHPVCPCCGENFEKNITSFRWTLMKHKDIIKELIKNGSTEKLIIDEYGADYTAKEFLEKEVELIIEYQDATEFS